MTQAEAPVCVVVGRAVSNPIRVIGQGKQVRLEFIQRKYATYRNAVVENVQIRFLEVDDALTPGILDVGIGNVPLRGNSPIENLRAAGNFVNIQSNVLADDSQCAADTVPGNAPADRVQHRDQIVHLVAEI